VKTIGKILCVLIVSINKVGKYSEAIDDCTKATSFDTNYAFAYVTRAAAYYFLSKCDQAIADCTKAIGLDPNYADAYVTRGGL
jgi:tetratricopeptide (TPR) repeat protein